jgi:uncharacterized protein
MLIDLILYIILGAVAGFSAGLFGLGGGVVIVPGLLWVFVQLHFPPSIKMHLAQGCSMGTMLFTSLSSSYRHHKLHNILWPVFKQLILYILAGVIIGACIAWWLHGVILSIIFACYLLVVAVKMLLDKKVNPQLDKKNINLAKKILIPYHIAGGIIIGGLSGLLGIGGGTLSVPYLSSAKLNIKNAIGTSSAFTFPIAVIGTIAYIIFGYLHTENPHIPWSTGFVYWPAVITIGPVSAICAQFGAKTTQYVPAAKLKKYFGWFVLLVCASLIWHIVLAFEHLN